ncbi:hypothetical protein Tco_0349825 [Tanacetum coccineum]
MNFSGASIVRASLNKSTVPFSTSVSFCSGVRAHWTFRVLIPSLQIVCIEERFIMKFVAIVSFELLSLSMKSLFDKSSEEIYVKPVRRLLFGRSGGGILSVLSRWVLMMRKLVVVEQLVQVD